MAAAESAVVARLAAAESAAVARQLAVAELVWVIVGAALGLAVAAVLVLEEARRAALAWDRAASQALGDRAKVPRQVNWISSSISVARAPGHDLARCRPAGRMPSAISSRRAPARALQAAAQRSLAKCLGRGKAKAVKLRPIAPAGSRIGSS